MSISATSYTIKNAFFIRSSFIELKMYIFQIFGSYSLDPKCWMLNIISIEMIDIWQFNIAKILRLTIFDGNMKAWSQSILIRNNGVFQKLSWCGISSYHLNMSTFHFMNIKIKDKYAKRKRVNFFIVYFWVSKLEYQFRNSSLNVVNLWRFDPTDSTEDLI